jgi:hypothetical protein
MRSWIAAAVGLGGMLLIVPAARADIGLVSISRTSGHPGDRVVARFGGYDQPWPHMPLYLVPAPRAPRVRPCLVHGVPTGCLARVRRAPRGSPFTPLGRIRYAPPRSGRFAFRVPRLAPGYYSLVIYCAPCYKGPGGSLIDTGPRFRILR